MSLIKTNFAKFLIAALVSPLLGSLAVAQVTYIPQPDFWPLNSNVSFTTPYATVLIDKTYTFQAGESRRVFGRVEAASSVATDVYFEASTRCLGPYEQSPVPESIHGVVGQNHEGNDTPFPQYSPTAGQLALLPSLLFRAPATGTYHCQLVVYDGDSSALTAIARDSSGFSITWLRVSSADDAGSNWWQFPLCNITSCPYLGGITGVFEEDLFYNDLWQPADNAAFVDASATAELTTCYQGTLSCPWYNQGNADGSVVGSHLELTQLDSNGLPCKVHQSNDETTMISNLAHHHPIYHSLKYVPIYPDCGSRKFRLNLQVRYVSGNPILLHGIDNAGGSAESFTNGFAINSVYGTALPIPNVVGATEADARHSITTAGYVVGQVSHVFGNPAGIIVAQNPPGNLIELPGSPVEITVSVVGTTIVPNLLSLPMADAISTIYGLGLTPSVSYMAACIEPGMVLNQNPTAGSVVNLGSTVHITVDNGDSRTCGSEK